MTGVQTCALPILQAELAVDGVRPATAIAPGVGADPELGFARLLLLQSGLGHRHASLKGKPSRRRRKDNLDVLSAKF